MAVTRRMAATGAAKGGSKSGSLNSYFKPLRNFFSRSNLWDLLVNPDRCFPIAILLLVAEVFINAAVIAKVPYTEIDWNAYMQEVEGVVNGTTDYSLLKGDTGPLVYPAGFVWIYMGLYYATQMGRNVRLGQCLFAVIYLVFLALVFRLVVKSRKLPPYTLAIMSLTSYRIHSIFILRLFNDPVAMLLLYAAINLFADDYWTLGSVFYSLAVSVKMNVLLFAPALFLAYLATQGIVGTVAQLAVCAAIQVAVAWPFLATNPQNYIMGAFDLARIFMHKWTVNWRFLPQWMFVHKGFHVGLLSVHAVLLLAAAYPFWQLLTGYARICRSGKKAPFAVQLLLLPLFMSNFIGIAMARSLHYQFYVWYYHQLSYMLWCTPLPTKVRLLLLGLIELCWNTYPSTDWSSALLHACHFVTIVALFVYLRKIQRDSESHREKEDVRKKLS